MNNSYNSRLITNKRLIFKITFFILFSSIICILLASLYLKKAALSNLAEDDAQKTSELIFETMNTRMQEGWAKEDLNKIINRIEYIRKDLKVHSYRSQKVEKLFGVHQQDRQIIANDPFIQKAMHGEQQFMIQKNGSIRYLYPMKASSECLSCHINAKIGDVNGVLDISYPPSEIKISLDSMIIYFIIFFVIAIVFIFYIFYFTVNLKMVKPLVVLKNKITHVSNSKEFHKEVLVKTNIKEIKSLQISFNKLLNKINTYYDKLLQNIYFNNLTSLPNYVKLEQDLEQKELNSLIIINIDDFRTINQFYGKKVGDKIIQLMAEVLSKKTKDIGTLYKLHSDEFAILLHKNIDVAFCERLVKDINKYDFIYENSTIHVTVSLGITYDEKKSIIEKTSNAVRKAINDSISVNVFENSIMVENEQENASHIEWTKNIEVALKEHKIIAFFQPIKEVATNTITKYETLARLEKDGVIYTPDKFIDVSKRSKQYHAFTRAMIHNSFQYFQDKKDISFSINFSIEDIQNSKCVTLLFEYLDKYKIGDRFVLELLETEEFDDFNIVNSFIKKLKRYNVKIAIDDFGSGYSNFTYIANLDIDFLKLDSSLIENIHTNTNSFKVVKNINTFAHDMGLKTIAEKVHCEEIEILLRELGVDYLQGYHIGKPKDAIL